MKKFLILCLLGMLVVGCMNEYEKNMVQDETILRNIFKANDLDPDKPNELSPHLTELDGTKIHSKDGRIAKINFSNRNLTIIPPEIGLLTGLVELDLSGNKIEELPEEIGNLVKLEKLNLNMNKLTALPASIGNLGKLVELHAGFNRLLELPQTIGDLNELATLTIVVNKLTTLPISMKELTNITYLPLTGNEFTEFPLVLTKMPNLGSVLLDVGIIDTTTIPAGVRNTGHGRYVFD